MINPQINIRFEFKSIRLLWFQWLWFRGFSHKSDGSNWSTTNITLKIHTPIHLVLF